MAARRAIIGLILASVFIISACATTPNNQPSGGTIDCSPEALIAAIEAANTTKEQVTVNLYPDCLYDFITPYEGDLSFQHTALPSIASPIVIHGNSAKLQVTYDHPSKLRVLHVQPNGQLTLNNLVVRARNLHNSCGIDGNGGLVYNEGTLTVNNVQFQEGLAIRGSAIANTGNLDVSGSRFENSFEYADVCAGHGGGIYNIGGSARIENSVFIGIAVGGSGCAIYSEHVITGSFEISGSQFFNNTCPGKGGAVYAKGDLAISNSSFQSNSSEETGGALHHHFGNLEITSSSFITNSAVEGGALFHVGRFSWADSGTNLVIKASDFVMNQAVDHGAAVHISQTDPEAEIILENNTFSHNVGPTAIYNSGPIYIHNNTISFNDGTGIYSQPKLTETRIEDSIVANNFIDCSISLNLVPLGANLDTDNTCAGFNLHTDPLLEPLANNGGPTLTHALPANSPAVDAATGDCPATDQRGEARPGGSACDLGAYESGLAAIGDTTIGDLPDLDTSGPPDKEGPGPIPDLDICVARVEMLVPCNEGPGDAYPTINALKPESVVEVTGQSVSGAYAVVRNPCFPELGCWVKKTTLVFYCDDQALPLISTPALALPEPDKPSGGPTCDPGAANQPDCEAGGGTWKDPGVGAPYCQCN